MSTLNTSQITNDVVTSLANRFANYLVTKIKSHIEDKKAHNAIFYQTAYEKYLSAAKEKFEKVKTLLYKQTPKYLYDFYECLGVQYKQTLIDTHNVKNLLEVGHKLIITGTGGIGKSIMMRHLFLNTIKETDCIPIFIELRGLNENNNINLIEVIYNNLKIFNFELEEKYFKFSLELGKYVIIFDGYDEVKNNLAKKVEEAILQLTNQFPQNYYIVSSRPMHNNFISWSDFIEMEAKGLTKEQALNLINKLDYDEKIKSKFYEALDNTLYEKYKTFALNPLLLTIMLMTFADGGDIPESFNEFYEQAFTALFKAHDASKGAYVRDKASKLGFNDFKLIFSHVCFKSFFKNKYEFTESEILQLINDAANKCTLVQSFNCEDYLKDLTDATCMLIRDGLDVRFSHRSFQEYFAAFYTTQLNDEIQTNLITSWLKESRTYNTSGFITMLYDMIPDRFEKNILFSGLLEIKKSCAHLEKIDIFGKFFNAIILIGKSNIALQIENDYYFAIYSLLRYRYYKNGNSKSNKHEESKLYKKLKELGYDNNHEIPIDIIKNELELTNLVINELNFFKIYDYGMQLLVELNNNKAKGRKFSAIIDNL